MSNGTALRAIVVGTSFGGRVQVPALRAAGFEIVALVGRGPDRTAARAEQLGVPVGTTDLGEALARLGDGGCVAVSTPPDARVEPVLAAVAAGAHVLCEKPFALRASEARAMHAAAEAAGVVALLGCEFRWATDEALLRRLITDGAIGAPIVATMIQFSSLVAGDLPQAFNPDWWFSVERGGGLLNAAGVHYVDRFRSWLGEVTAVSATLAVVGDRPATAAEDTYTATLRFESGCTALLQHCSALRGAPTRVCRVIGGEGSVWLEDGGTWLGDRDGSRRVDVPDDLRLPAPPAPSDDPKEVFTTLELPPYTRLAERFRDLVRGRAVDPAAPPTPTFLDGVRNQLVLDAIRESSASGGEWVDVDPVP